MWWVYIKSKNNKKGCVQGKKRRDKINRTIGRARKGVKEVKGGKKRGGGNVSGEGEGAVSKEVICKGRRK